MNHSAFLNVMTTAALVGGMFFLLVGALGVLRLPDVYLRMIAASKCVTLGITGMLLGAVFHFIALGTASGTEGGAEGGAGSSAIAASTKAVLVILFQFTAGPVGTHMLARSAHVDRVRTWKGTLSDDLSEDTGQAPPRDGIEGHSK